MSTQRERREFIAGIIMGFCAMATGQNNLLQNGNFERAADPSTGVPTFWTESYSSSSIGPSRSGTQYYGKYSLRIDDDNPFGSEGVISDKIVVSPGVIYTVEGWVKQYESTNDARLYIKYYNASDIEVGSISVHSGTIGIWTHVSQSLRAARDTTYARVICYSTIASTGKMLFDGVAFYRAATQSLVDNPDFSLDAGVGTPINWNRVGVSGTVSVASNRLKLEDTSTTEFVWLETTAIPVVIGGDYTASASAWVAPGSAGAASIYLKFYNDQGVELLSTSNSLYTQSTWTKLSVTGNAPPNAVTARVLAYSATTSTGTFYFDDFDLTPSYVQHYAAPNAQGYGDGGSPENAAKFNDPTFWHQVRTNLGTSSVRVIFLNGNYTVDSPSEQLLIANLGTLSNHLLLEGESIYGARFVRTNSATEWIYIMVTLADVMNMTVRNLHWQDLQTSSPANTGYCLGIISPNDCTYVTYGVVLEGLSFIDHPNQTYGLVGPYGTCTYKITIRNSEFVGVGYDSHAHISYNIHTGGIAFTDNYCEDSSGAYVRCDGECYDCIVENNVFVSTGNWINPNQHFIEVFVSNLTDPGENWFGIGYSFKNNEFDYWTPSGVAIEIYHLGYDPFDGSATREHLLTSLQGDTLRYGSTYQKKNLIKDHYHLDFNDNSSIEISGNTRIGYHAYRLELETRADNGTTEYEWPDPRGGEGVYNISEVDGD